MYFIKMLDEWDLHAIVDGVPPTTGPSMPSVTTTTIPANNNQTFGDWGLGAVLNDFPPTPNESFSTYASASATTLAPPIPTIPNSQLMNDQTLDSCGPQWMTNQFYTNIVPSSSSSILRKTTNVPITPTTSMVYKQNQDGAHRSNQHTIVNSFSTINVCSSASLLGAIATTTTAPTNVEYQPNSSFQGLYQPVMSTNIVNHVMQNLNNPPKASFGSKNWPILSLPGYGKLTKTATHKQQQSLDLSKCTNINAQSPSSCSNARKLREKRIYKMPLEAVKNDPWCWSKYGEKSVDGSPYPRVYYKCNTSKECEAKRRVEQNRSDPDVVTLKYTGLHNHPMPEIMNSPVCSAVMNPTGSSIGIIDDNKKSNSSKVTVLDKHKEL